MTEQEESPKDVFRSTLMMLEESFTAQEKEEFSKYKDAQDMLQSVHGRATKHPQLQPGPVQRFCRGIDRLSSALEPYFTVITTCIQSDPRIAGLVWGSILLIFRLSHNYSAFMDKLSEIFNSLSDELSVLLAHGTTLHAAVEARAKDKGKESNSRLYKSLSDLYIDLVGFCQYVRTLLSGNRKRDWLKLAAQRTFKNLDSHFAAFLQRMGQHKRVLELELSAASSEVLVNQYHLIHALIAEIKTKEDIQAAKTAERADSIDQTTLLSVKQWLSAPIWQQAFEKAISKRFPGTNSWYIECETYQRWHAGGNVVGSNCGSAPPIPDKSGHLLVLQAKPGYGKTILCSTIVDNCRNQPLTKDNHNATQTVSASPVSVAFYFFDKQNMTDACSDPAFRAVTTQLLHIHQANRRISDLALVMKYSKGCGQTIASDAEVRCLLTMYLQRLPGTILIFDGIDECDDYDNFLHDLNEVAAGADCKILLTCRPTVSLNNHFKNFKTSTMLLQDDENAQDIERYIRPEIQELFQDEKLDEDEVLEDIVDQVCQRSRSMFLWANLMISYLKQDFLTPADRHEAISELNTFEDLEVLYLRILQSIKKQCRGQKAWTNVRRLFQWVSMARRPLRVSELRVALALEIGKPVSKRRHLPKFDKTIPKISGALIEISSDETVRFIHLSVLEFLTAAMESPERPLKDAPPPLAIEPRSVHGSLAAECISYLICDLPGQPLGGSSRVKASPQKLLKEYPFLLYSTQQWAFHAYEALAPTCLTSKSTKTAETIGLIDIITSFISNKGAVTAWTEACWTFGMAPETYGLSDQIGGSLALFVQELKRMNDQWGPTLLKTPNEIWEPSIPAFMQSPFWVETNAARVTVLGANHDNLQGDTQASMRGNPLTIISETSQNGLEVGIIKAWPCSLFRELQNPDNTAIGSCCHDWKVNYTITRLADKQDVLCMTFDIPTENVFIVLGRASRSGNAKQFNFPAAISQDLRRIALLGCVLKFIPVVSSLGNVEYSFHSQNLIHLRKRMDYSSNPAVSFFSREIKLSESKDTEDWYQTKFSPDGRYLLGIRGSMAPGTSRSFWGYWELTVHRDDSQPHERPNFEFVAEQTTQASAVSDPNFVFHPTDPVLVISRVGNVVLWYFEEKLSRTMTVLKQPLRGMHFSPCGTFLEGVSAEASTTGQPITIPYSYKPGIKSIDYTPAKSHVSSTTSSKDLPLPIRGKSALASQNLTTVRVSQPATLESGLVTWNHGHTGAKAVMLQQDNTDTPGIFLYEVDEKGNTQQHQLTVLPKSSTLNHSNATLLTSNFSRGEKRKQEIGLVLNKTAQELYDVDERPDFALPALITRRVESIPSDMGRGFEKMIEPEDGSGFKKRRLTYGNDLPSGG